MKIFKKMFNNYKQYVLAKYEEEYEPQILSNYNSESKFYIIRLGEVVNGNIIPYDFKKHYSIMPENYNFDLYAIETNGIITELFSGIPVDINSDEPNKFKNLKLEELESLQGNYFHAFLLEEISKEEMAKKICSLKESCMIRYYNDLFKMEMSKQKVNVEDQIVLKKKERYIEEHADDIIKGFVKTK